MRRGVIRRCNFSLMFIYILHRCFDVIVSCQTFHQIRPIYIILKNGLSLTLTDRQTCTWHFYFCDVSNKLFSLDCDQSFSLLNTAIPFSFSSISFPSFPSPTSTPRPSSTLAVGVTPSSSPILSLSPDPVIDPTSVSSSQWIHAPLQLQLASPSPIAPTLTFIKYTTLTLHWSPPLLLLRC